MYHLGLSITELGLSSMLEERFDHTASRLANTFFDEQLNSLKPGLFKWSTSVTLTWTLGISDLLCSRCSCQLTSADLVEDALPCALQPYFVMIKFSTDSYGCKVIEKTYRDHEGSVDQSDRRFKEVICEMKRGKHDEHETCGCRLLSESDEIRNEAKKGESNKHQAE